MSDPAIPAVENRLPKDLLFLIMFFTAATMLTVAGFGLHDWRPAVASAHGKGVDGIISYLLAVTGLIFVIGHGVLIWFLWRYQGDGPSAYQPVSPRTEWLVTLPTVLFMTVMSEVGVFALALPVWGQVYGPAPADAFVVEVVGKQFEWIVRYPGKDGKFGRVDPTLVDDADNPLGLDEKDPAAKDDVVKRGQLILPVGGPIAVRLRSLDVLHSFTIPSMRVKQDIIPGYTARIKFVPEIAGTYEIACTELCGLGHYKMRGLLQVKTAEEFKKWFADQPGMFE